MFTYDFVVNPRQKVTWKSECRGHSLQICIWQFSLIKAALKRVQRSWVVKLHFPRLTMEWMAPEDAQSLIQNSKYFGKGPRAAKFSMWGNRRPNINRRRRDRHWYPMGSPGRCMLHMLLGLWNCHWTCINELFQLWNVFRIVYTIILFVMSALIVHGLRLHVCTRTFLALSRYSECRAINNN